MSDDNDTKYEIHGYIDVVLTVTWMSIVRLGALQSSNCSRRTDQRQKNVGRWTLCVSTRQVSVRPPMTSTSTLTPSLRVAGRDLPDTVKPGHEQHCMLTSTVCMWHVLVSLANVVCHTAMAWHGRTSVLKKSVSQWHCGCIEAYR